METEMIALKKEMRLVLSTLLINIKTIILFGFLGLSVSLLITLIPINNMYKAEASVCSTLFNDNWDNTKSVRLIASFFDIFESSLIQDKIIDVMGGSISRDELNNMTSIRKTSSETVLKISTRHKNPSIAIKAANAIAHVLIIELDRFYETPSGIKILDKANEAKFEYTGKNVHILICVLFTFLSALGCCIYFVIKILASDKIIFIEDCTINGSLEIMGVIPYTVKSGT